MKDNSTYNLTIIQPSFEPYREDFYRIVSELLRDRFNLKLVTSDQSPDDALIVGDKLRKIGIEWENVKERKWSINNTCFSFRMVKKFLQSADLVVMELQASKIDNILACLFQGRKVILWGHAKPKEKKFGRVEAAVERFMCIKASHVLVYTQEGQDYLVIQGISPQKITILQNANNARQIREIKSSLNLKDFYDLETQYGDQKNTRFVLYLGNFTENKRPDFLLEAMKWLQVNHPSIKLLVGSRDCPLELENLSNVIFLGYLDNLQKAKLCNLVESIWMPGRIGLVAVDALAMNLPIFTTRNNFHAPEISYLELNKSLFFLPNNPQEFAKSYSKRKIKKIDVDIEKVPSIQHMASKFADVVKSLAYKL